MTPSVSVSTRYDCIKLGNSDGWFCDMGYMYVIYHRDNNSSLCVTLVISKLRFLKPDQQVRGTFVNSVRLKIWQQHKNPARVDHAWRKRKGLFTSCNRWLPLRSISLVRGANREGVLICSRPVKERPEHQGAAFRNPPDRKRIHGL